MNNINKDSRNILRMQKRMLDGLMKIRTDQNWFEKYNTWKQLENHNYDSNLIIENPLSLNHVGERQFFDIND